MDPTRPAGGRRAVVLEAGVGLVVVIGGLITLQYGWQGCLWLLERTLGTDAASGIQLSSFFEGVSAGGLLFALYGLVGLGVPSAYRRVRGYDPEGLHRPTRRECGWTVGLVTLAVALVGAGTLLGELGGGPPQGPGFTVPVVVVGDPLGPLPQIVGGPASVTLVAWPLLLAVALGIGVGGLAHGVLQRSLRRVVAPAAAVIGTALVLTVLVGRLGDPVATGIVLLVGLVAGVAYERTGRLWVPIVAYAAFNGVALVAAGLAMYWTA